jgi:hypothetical protein
MNRKTRTRIGGRTPKLVVRLRRFFASIGRRPQTTETIVRLSPTPYGGTARNVETRPLTSTDVTNVPAQRKSAAYYAAQSTAIKSERRRNEWYDGCSRVLLLWVGFALIIGLAILFSR